MKQTYTKFYSDKSLLDIPEKKLIDISFREKIPYPTNTHHQIRLQMEDLNQTTKCKPENILARFIKKNITIYNLEEIKEAIKWE